MKSGDASHKVPRKSLTVATYLILFFVGNLVGAAVGLRVGFVGLGVGTIVGNVYPWFCDIAS